MIEYFIAVLHSFCKSFYPTEYIRHFNYLLILDHKLNQRRKKSTLKTDRVTLPLEKIEEKQPKRKVEPLKKEVKKNCLFRKRKEITLLVKKKKEKKKKRRRMEGPRSPYI